MRKKEIVEWLERISAEMGCHHKCILELEAENKKLKANGDAIIDHLKLNVSVEAKEEKVKAKKRATKRKK